jgi:hypothetical protein
LAKKREVKTRDDMVNLAQDDQAYLGALFRVLRALRRIARGAQRCSGHSGESTEPRVS